MSTRVRPSRICRRIASSDASLPTADASRTPGARFAGSACRHPDRGRRGPRPDRLRRPRVLVGSDTRRSRGSRALRADLFQDIRDDWVATRLRRRPFRSARTGGPRTRHDERVGQRLRSTRSAGGPTARGRGDRRHVSSIRAQRDALVAKLAACESLTVRRPEGAFYALIGYSHDQSSVHVAEQLAERGVLVRTGSEYGPSGEHFIRLSFATSLEQLEQAVPIVTAFFDELATTNPRRTP